MYTFKREPLEASMQKSSYYNKVIDTVCKTSTKKDQMRVYIYFYFFLHLFLKNYFFQNENESQWLLC